MNHHIDSGECGDSGKSLTILVKLAILVQRNPENGASGSLRGRVVPEFWIQSGGVVGTAPTWVPIWRPGSPWGPFSVFGSPLAPMFYFRLKNACSHHLMWTIWLLVRTQTSFNESHASLSVKVSSVIKNIQILEYFCQKKVFFLQWITLFWSIFQIYAFWVPISAVKGPHWVPISLNIGSPLAPH